MIYGKNQSCGCYVKQLHSKENTYIRDNDTYIGKTQNGYEFIIDVDDYEKVSKYCWHQHNDGYLRTRYDCVEGHNKYILMHKLIMEDWTNSFEIDHINGNPFDNRRSNLRIISHTDNMKNAKIYSNNTSGHKGVYYSKRERKWKAHIQCSNERIF